MPSSTFNIDHKLNSAYSAQQSRARPNPLLEATIRFIFRNGLASEQSRTPRIADQGCGKLRHLPLFRKYFDQIYLVDTRFQLERRQKLFSVDDTTILEYVCTKRDHGKKVLALSDVEFDRVSLNLDIVFNVAALDVETPRARKQMLVSSWRNLREGGILVLIIPRNDQTILRRCNKYNSYLDGHAFQHHGVVTFYKNYRDISALVRTLKGIGFAVEADLSVYRHACLILRKELTMASAQVRSRA